MKIIYGRSQSGKSKYIYDMIRRGQSGMSYIITPEQFSFSAEKRLVDSLENGATVNVEVLSFARMAHRVMDSLGLLNRDIITKSEKAMIIYDAIANNQNKLNFLGKTQENVDTILTGITEFKKHNISLDNLKEKVENESNQYLKAKLNDMQIMYEALEERTKDYIDENDVLTVLADNIERSHLFDGATFYIDEFAGFTKQEYSVISKLNQIGNVYITVCTDSIKISPYITPESDVFYDNKQTIETLKEIANLDDDDFIRIVGNESDKTPELAHLEKNLFNIPYKQYYGDAKNITITMAQKPIDEIISVAENINRLVREENYRYRDISIICKEIDTYSSLAKIIFQEYEIPVFIDDTKDLSQNLIMKYALSIIDIFDKNFSYEAMFNYLKTGFVKIDNLFEIENYVIKYGIKGSKWYVKPWDEYSDEQNKIVTPLIELKKALSGKKTATQISSEIYNFINTNLAESKPEIESDEELCESWNILVEILEEISKIFGDEQMSFDKFSKILKNGISNRELAEIPNTQDKVILGDVDRSRSGSKRAVFIIGVNDGVFPSVNKSEGFFSDKERIELKEKGLELAKTTIEKSYEENFNIYRAFTIANEKLFISYASSDLDGGSLRPSMLISRIKGIFKNLEVKEVEISDISSKEITFWHLLANIGEDKYYPTYKWFEKNDKNRLDRALQGIYYTNQPDKITDENIDKLYGKTINTSISKLETYQKCPFMYFLRYGLKLRPKDTSDVNSLDIGTFLHSILDEFFKATENYKEISDDDLKKIVNRLVNEALEKYEKFGLTPKYKVLSKRLKKVVFYSLKYIIEGLKSSSFDVLGTEVPFGKSVPEENEVGSSHLSFPAIQIKLDNGKQVIVEGKIDRIDIAKLPTGDYIRIIDYKTYLEDIYYTDVYAGIQLQLLTYVKVGAENENAIPAGALYFHANEPLIKKLINRQVTREEIEAEIREQYQMKGLILADSNVICAMDKNILNEEKYMSKIIPASLNKKNPNEVKIDKNIVTREQFQGLIDYTDKLLKDITKEILTGNIEISPIYADDNRTSKTPCENCDFKSICKFDPKLANNRYHYAEKMDKNKILEKINQKEKK